MNWLCYHLQMDSIVVETRQSALAVEIRQFAFAAGVLDLQMDFQIAAAAVEAKLI